MLNGIEITAETVIFIIFILVVLTKSYSYKSKNCNCDKVMQSSRGRICIFFYLGIIHDKIRQMQAWCVMNMHNINFHNNNNSKQYYQCKKKSYYLSSSYCAFFAFDHSQIFLLLLNKTGFKTIIISRLLLLHQFSLRAHFQISIFQIRLMRLSNRKVLITDVCQDNP